MSNIQTFQKQSQIAKYFATSGLFADAKAEATAFIKIQAGRELGIEPFQAMNAFDIIQGKIAIKPIALAGLLKRSGKYDYRIIDSDDKNCSIEFYEKDKLIGVEDFSIDDAKNLGLLNRDQWRKQPKNMLTWRCLAYGIRHYCPDVLMGAIYDTFEVEEFSAPKNEVKQLPQKVEISQAQEATIYEWRDLINDCDSLENLEKLALQIKEIDDEIIRNNLREVFKNKKQELNGKLF